MIQPVKCRPELPHFFVVVVGCLTFREIQRGNRATRFGQQLLGFEFVDRYMRLHISLLHIREVLSDDYFLAVADVKAVGRTADLAAGEVVDGFGFCS